MGGIPVRRNKSTILRVISSLFSLGLILIEQNTHISTFSKKEGGYNFPYRKSQASPFDHNLSFEFEFSLILILSVLTILSTKINLLPL